MENRVEIHEAVFESIIGQKPMILVKLIDAAIARPINHFSGKYPYSFWVSSVVTVPF